jgi:hypothetical protein
MANLTLRAVKGSPLTNTELDGNFEYFTGSHAVTGSLTITEDLIVNGSIVGNISGSVLVTTNTGVQITGSLIISGSNTFINIGPAQFTGSVSSTGGFTGSLSGTATTASYVITAQTASYFSGTVTSASYAATASFVQIAQTASYVLNSISSSFASTASFVRTAQTASYVLNAVSSSFASTASFVQTAQTASYVVTAQTASYITTAQTASYINPLAQNIQITGSLNQTGSLTLGYKSFNYSNIDISKDINNYHNIIIASGVEGQYANTMINLLQNPTSEQSLISFSSPGYIDIYGEKYINFRSNQAGGASVRVTGSVNISSLITLGGLNPLPAAVNGSIAFSSSGDFYLASGSAWHVLTL